MGIYSLSNHIKKLQAGYHNQIGIQVKNAKDKLVPFDEEIEPYDCEKIIQKEDKI